MVQDVAVFELEKEVQARADDFVLDLSKRDREERKVKEGEGR